MARLWLRGPSEPRVPGGVHATQVVQAVGRGHQGVDFALSALKLSQVVEAGHDGRDGLLDQRHQLLGVHVLWLAGRGQRHGRVLLGLLVPGDDLVSEDRLQDAVNLPGTRDPLKTLYLTFKPAHTQSKKVASQSGKKKKNDDK